MAKKEKRVKVRIIGPLSYSDKDSGRKVKGSICEMPELTAKHYLASGHVELVDEVKPKTPKATEDVEEKPSEGSGADNSQDDAVETKPPSKMLKDELLEHYEHLVSSGVVDAYDFGEEKPTKDKLSELLKSKNLWS